MSQSPKIIEAVILAGGRGTRLGEAYATLPKCLVAVREKPFLFYMIEQLKAQGIEKFVLALGFLHEQVEEFMQLQFPLLHYVCSIEQEPLGTGGAINLASKSCSEADVLLVNADTFFKVNIEALANFHFANNASCTLALKQMKNCDRYGIVELDAAGQVNNFKEKQPGTSGWINGGTYILNLHAFFATGLTGSFSFEKEYLEKQHGKQKIMGLAQEAYFIDIGIPADLNKAQSELPQILRKLNIKKWGANATLFLDRDGVINIEKDGGYINNWQEFAWSDGALKAFKILRPFFHRIVIVTNQRGVTKAETKQEDLDEIHTKLTAKLVEIGAPVDAIYYCTDMEDTSTNRKPNTGMALQAREQFPEINFSQSIMVGDKESDIAFGKALAMITIFVSNTHTDVKPPDSDAVYNSLWHFASALLADNL